jgi:hypothetical protein
MFPCELCGPKSRWENNIKTDLRDIGWGCGLDSYGSGPVAGSCEHGNEPLHSIEFLEILQRLSNWQLLKKESDAWR